MKFFYGNEKYMFKKLTMLLMYISLILVLIGCRESHKGIINSQLEVSHEPQSIKKIAVLSFNKVHLRSLDLPQIKNRIIDSMSEQIDSRIIKSISFKNPEITIIEPPVLLNKINNSRFASDLNDFVESIGFKWVKNLKCWGAV